MKIKIALMIIMAGFIIQPLTVKAMYNYSPHYYSFTHGSVEVGVYVDELEVIVDSNNVSVGTSFGLTTVCNFNFDKYYSGTVTLNYSYNSSDFERNINFWSIIVDGGKIDSINNTSGKITFRVYDKDSFTVYMFYQTAPMLSLPSNDPGFDFTSASSSLTAETNHNNEYDNLARVDVKLSTLNNNLVSIASDIHTIYSDTGNIVQALDLLSDNTINTDVENMLSTLTTSTNTVSSNINSLKAYLITTLGTIDVNNPGSTIYQCINDISGDMDTIVSDLTTIRNTLDSISSSLTGLVNLVTNIDNTIDTITFTNLNSQFLGYTNDFENFSLTQGSVSSGYYYVFQGVDFSTHPNAIFKIELNVGNFSFPNFKVYQEVNGNLREIPRSFVRYYVNGRNNFVIYLMIDTYSGFPTSGVHPLVIDFGRSSYFYRYSYLPDNAVYVIDDEDIEYWKLLSYFQQLKEYDYSVGFNSDLYNRLGDIIDAINAVSVTVNVTSNEITNVTNNFDFDIDIINNIQNDIKLDFDYYNGNVSDADITLDLTPYSDTIGLYKANITALWASPLVSVPTILSVIVFVFLVILG